MNDDGSDQEWGVWPTAFLFTKNEVYITLGNGYEFRGIIFNVVDYDSCNNLGIAYKRLEDPRDSTSYLDHIVSFCDNYIWLDRPTWQIWLQGKPVIPKWPGYHEITITFGIDLDHYLCLSCSHQFRRVSCIIGKLYTCKLAKLLCCVLSEMSYTLLIYASGVLSEYSSREP